MSTATQPAASKKKPSSKKNDKNDELPPEDQKLKDDLAQFVEKIVSFQENDLTEAQLTEQKEAILGICSEMRQATASMTAIPKPLKFLRAHIPTLRNYYTKRVTGVDPSLPKDTQGDVSTDNADLILPVDDEAGAETTRPKYQQPVKPWPNQVYLADLLSILSMIIPNETGLLLTYRFDAIQGDFEGFDLSMVNNWGISYVQALCNEISNEYNRIQFWESAEADENDDESQLTDENGNKSDKKDNNDSDSIDGDAEEEEAILQRTTSLKPSLSSTPSLHASRSLQSNASLTSKHTSANDSTNTSTMTDTDSKDKKGVVDNKDDEVKSTDKDAGEKDDKDGKKAGKKELTDEEKAKLDEEALKVAKSKDKVPKPVTNATLTDLQTLSVRFLPHLFQHGCEIDAVDLLFETDNIKAISPHIDLHNFGDVLQYVEGSNRYTDDLEDQFEIYALVVNIYLGLQQFSYALTAALHISPFPAQKRALAKIFHATRDIPNQQLSLAYMLAQFTPNCAYLCADIFNEIDEVDLAVIDQIYTEVISDLPIVTDSRAIEVLQKGSCGSLDQQILNDLGVTKAKTVDDVCRVDDEREDPYQWFAVGLANTGTKLVDVLEGKSSAVKAKQDAQIGSSSTAQIALAKGLATGLIHIGDVEEGYSLVDPYLNPQTDEGHSNKVEMKEQTMVGGIVATALCGAGVTNDFNAGAALLSDYVTDTEQHSPAIRAATCLSLGLCYLNTHNSELRDLLLPMLMGDDLDDQGKGRCALALGLIFLSSNDETIAQLLVATLDEVRLTPSAQRLVCLACGLLIFNNQSIPENLSELFSNIALTADIPGPNNTTTSLDQGVVEARTAALKEYLAVVLDICAHVGSCDMLLIQSLLRQLSTNEIKVNDLDDDDDSDSDEDEAAPTPTTTSTTTTPTPGTPVAAPQAAPITAPGKPGVKKVSLGDVQTTKEKIAKDVNIKQMKQVTRSLATLAISFISLSDDLSKQCTMRLLSHLLECGSAEIRNAVPLAIALLQVSQPSPAITDQLIRLTHDISAELAINATLAIGLCAAGSNNSRALAGISGMISETHDKTAIQIGRIAQGLTMLGQGTLTLSTTCFNDSVLNIRSVVALFVILSQMIEPHNGLCNALPLWTILPVCARPKVMVTRLVDDDNSAETPQNVPIPVKMGQVQGGMMLGRKTVLSGIQVTHTPVVIGVGSYVQVDDDDYTALSHCLEGTVLITKSPAADQ